MFTAAVEDFFSLPNVVRAADGFRESACLRNSGAGQRFAARLAAFRPPNTHAVTLLPKVYVPGPGRLVRLQLLDTVALLFTGCRGPVRNSRAVRCTPRRLQQVTHP